HGGAFFLRNVARGEGSGSHVAITHAGDDLLQVTDVAGVGALTQVVTDGLIHLSRFLRTKVSQKMLGKRKDILSTLSHRRKPTGPAGDSIVEITPKPALRLFLQQISVGRAH